jgi:hypothetical protein
MASNVFSIHIFVTINSSLFFTNTRVTISPPPLRSNPGYAPVHVAPKAGASPLVLPLSCEAPRLRTEAAACRWMARRGGPRMEDV